MDMKGYEQLQNPSGIVIDMNLLNERYKVLLSELMEGKETIKENYKPYIKQLIGENISNAEFIKSPRRNEPERVCNKETSECSIDVAIKQNTQENLTDIFAVSSMIRKELLSHDKWNFKGSFDNFTLPSYLSLLLKWILVGPNKEISGESRKKSVDKDISVISQLVLQAVKTKKQVDYKQQGQLNDVCYVTKETPFSVGLGLHMYNKTRSKAILDVLSDLGLSISYEKVCSIKKDIVTLRPRLQKMVVFIYHTWCLPTSHYFLQLTISTFRLIHLMVETNFMVVFQQKDMDEIHTCLKEINLRLIIFQFMM